MFASGCPALAQISAALHCCCVSGCAAVPVRAKQPIEQDKLSELLAALDGKGYAALDVSKWR